MFELLIICHFVRWRTSRPQVKAGRIMCKKQTIHKISIIKQFL